VTRYTVNGICEATKKRQYIDRRNALAALEATAERVKEDPMTWNAYVCKKCQQWHIGHIQTRKLTIYDDDAALVERIVYE
jgi:hypothetical protein